LLFIIGKAECKKRGNEFLPAARYFALLIKEEKDEKESLAARLLFSKMSSRF